MKRGARDSQVINNFFTLATIIMITVVIVLYSKYIVKDEDQKNPQKENIQLECEQQNYTYSKVFNQKLLNKSIKALNKGYYKLEGSYLKAEFMPSSIQEVVSLAEMNKFFIDAIGTNPKEDIEKYLKIKYELIENDKKNPNKKNEECTLNSGSVMTSFRINSKEIFRVYTDFQFMYKNAIKQRVDCSIKVFKNNVQK
ncbi:hypothetical protein [Arcobacter sp. LA11]|uniref:hypothetical protein n=1 Tax=Arcobacter sp. LA11 TaxID=1898176 RepID=UPI00093228CC|nr:hypothetical protein [Arcobacter sp. LA11]